MMIAEVARESQGQISGHFLFSVAACTHKCTWYLCTSDSWGRDLFDFEFLTLLPKLPCSENSRSDVENLEHFYQVSTLLVVHTRCYFASSTCISHQIC